MNGWIWSDNKPRDFVKETNHWFRKYLALRKRNRNLLKETRRLKGVLCHILKND